MIAVDTNILIHAHREESTKHKLAFKALESLATSSLRWAIPLFCLGEFLRVITHSRIFQPAHSPDQAAESLHLLLSAPNVVVLYPSDEFPQIFTTLVSAQKLRGNLIFDGQIAALCKEHGIEKILTEDEDFQRFPFLRIESLDSFSLAKR